jgi:hypothetical protein
MKAVGIINKIEFTTQQLDNLKIFLLRTNLQGSEVYSFNEIVQILENAKKIEEE